MNWRLLFLVILVICGNGSFKVFAAEQIYQTPADFIAESFADNPPAAQTLWLTDALKTDTATILGRPYGQLRVRYWGDTARSAWILEEIGRTHAITAGFVIAADRLETVSILIFREIRGWEVRYPFFVEQFTGAGLTEELDLNQNIDNITGATLSVKAVKKMARLALRLHQELTVNE